MKLRKRKDNQIPLIFRLFKRRKLNKDYIIDDEWVSASSTANYLIKDPILDYLYIQKRAKGEPVEDLSNIDNICVLSDILKRQGVLFESKVIEFLNKRIVNNYRNFITIAHSQSDILDVEKYRKTLDAIQCGIPFIYQAVLHDESEKVYGSPDLLVRSDYMKFICSNIQVEFPEASTRIIGNCKKSVNYYYFVVDIKNSTLYLRANGINLLNQGRMKAYKGQLYIYHKMLSKIQNFNSGMAFILGRKYKYKCNQELYYGFGWFDKLGCIDYRDEKKDKQYIDHTQKAIEWRRNVQMNYKDMSLYPLPSHINLYPNMCNKDDDEYRGQKKKLAEYIGEHTLVCWVGWNHRYNAHSKRIQRFDDNRCNVDILEITGDILRKKISNILKVNQDLSPDQEIFIPDKISNDLYQWRENVNEAYVDFETVPYIILDNYQNIQTPTTNIHGQMIFMIGIYHLDLNGEWVYTSFIVDNLNAQQEKYILMQFTNFIINKGFKKLFHWGKSAEPAMYRNSIACHNIINSLNDDIWCDLCSIFQNDCVAIKGALSYGLKNIARAMYNHKMIDTLWNEDNNIDSGTNVIVEAYKIYDKLRENNYNKLSEDPRMNNIIKYNKMDCVILQEIMKYIRENH